MRVVYDARSVDRGPSGVGAYAASLLAHLTELLGPRDRILVLRRRSGAPLHGDPRLQERVVPGDTKSPLGLAAASLADFSGWSLFHSTADVLPVGLRCPAVVTVHDLMWLEAPHLAAAFLPTRLANGVWYRANIRRAIRVARRILTPSAATADAVRRRFPESARRVTVAHHGVPAPRVDAGADRRRLRGVVPEGARYALAVGQGSPYKNHATLLRAFAAAGDDPRFLLVLVRRFARRDPELRALLSHPRIARRVVALHRVSDDVLAALYRHARFVVQPSVYEGFGLPVVEAMAVGTPVLASRADALREVAGGAALHVDAGDEAALSRAMARLDADHSLRAELSSRGLARAAVLSWRRCAEVTWSAYHEALGLSQSAPGARGVCSVSMAPSTAT